MRPPPCRPQTIHHSLKQKRDSALTRPTQPEAPECKLRMRIVRRVTEGLADAVRGSVGSLFEIAKRLCGPEFSPQLLARDQFTPLEQQTLKNLEGRLGQPNQDTLVAQFCGMQIHFEDPEANDSGCLVWFRHRQHPVSQQTSTFPYFVEKLLALKGLACDVAYDVTGAGSSSS